MQEITAEQLLIIIGKKEVELEHLRLQLGTQTQTVDKLNEEIKKLKEIKPEVN